MILGPRQCDEHEICVTSCLMLISSLWASLALATAEISPSTPVPDGMTISDEPYSFLWEGSGVLFPSSSFARDEQYTPMSNLVSRSTTTVLHPSFVSQIATPSIHQFSLFSDLMTEPSETDHFENLSSSLTEYMSSSWQSSLTETHRELLKETPSEFESSEPTVYTLSRNTKDISFSPNIAYATRTSSVINLTSLASSTGNQMSAYATPISTFPHKSNEIFPSTTNVSFSVDVITSSPNANVPVPVEAIKSSSTTNILVPVDIVTSSPTTIFLLPVDAVLSSASPASDESSETHFSIVLKSYDCFGLDKVNLIQELSRLMSRAIVLAKGYAISIDGCNSEINFNVTVSAGIGNLDSLTDDDLRNNLTLLLHNRTFHIVQIKRHEAESNINVTTTNSTRTTITVVTKNEFSAYVAVGVCFGLVLIVCISVCCAKCCIKRPPKTLGVSRSPPMHLRLEDYTLTPIPRPGTLYVDYYRGSLTGDLYATTPVGSVSSTPTVEQGVVQPFDTSIVPLEDSAPSDDGTRRDSVESNALPPNMRTFDVRTIADHGFIYCTTRSESKERLHAKVHQPTEMKNIGVANPIFQRY